MIVRRLVLVISIVFCGSLAFAAASLAAGGGGGLGPGSFTFTNTSASAFFGGKGGPPQPSFDVFVSRGLNSFQPDDGNGLVSVMQSTIVQFTQFDPTGAGGSACFIIPDGDFTNQGLRAAALHTTLTAAEFCPGKGSPVGASSKAAPLGGKGGGLVLPIQVDITWLGSGVVATTTDEFSFTCLQVQEEGSNVFKDALGGSASGTIGSMSGLTTLAADITSQSGTVEVQGSTTPPCFAK